MVLADLILNLAPMKLFLQISRPRAVGRTFLSAIALLPLIAMAQPASKPNRDFWRPDGPVRSAIVTNGILYFGGSFSYIGPASGAAGLWDLTTQNSEPIAKLNGSVLVSRPDGLGGWFVGGAFTTVTGGPQNLVHLRVDGSVDEAFLPNPNAAVRTLHLSGGRMFVGGDFQQIAGVVSPFLAVLNSTSGGTSGLRLDANASVRCFSEAGGILYLGGTFTSIRTFNGNSAVGNVRTRLAAVNLATSTLTPWGAGAGFGAGGGNAGVNAIAVFDDTIYAGGEFTTAAGKPRKGLAAFTAASGESTPWNPNPQDTANNPSVNCLLAQPEGLYVGGNFTSIGARNRRDLALVAYSSSGQANEAFSADTDGPVTLLASAPEGQLVVGGSFSTINGVSRRALAKVALADSQIAPVGPRFSLLKPITAQVVANVYTYSRLGDREFVGGDFLSFGGVSRSNLAALNLETGLATAWNPSSSGAITAMALAPSQGVLYVAGTITNLGGQTRRNGGGILLTDGQPTDFRPILTGTITSISILGDRGYFGGQFTQAGGKTRNNLAEFNLLTSAVSDWAPNPGGTIETVLATPGQIYIGGQFNGVAGSTTNNNLALITTVVPVRVVTNFSPRANGRVADLRLLGNRLYVGGEFTQIGNAGRSRFALLNPDTGLEAQLLDLAIPTTGLQRVDTTLVVGNTLYVGGNFSAVGGEARARGGSASLNSGIASGWNPGFDGEVRDLLLSSHSLVAIGDFTRLGLVGTNPNINGTNVFSHSYLAVFDTRPMITQYKLNATGNSEISYFDGDGTGTQVEIQYQDALGAPWQKLLSEPISGRHLPAVDPAGISSPMRFYRVIAQ